MILRRSILKSALAAALMPLARAFAPKACEAIDTKMEVERTHPGTQQADMFTAGEKIQAGDILVWDDAVDRVRPWRVSKDGCFAGIAVDSRKMIPVGADWIVEIGDHEGVNGA